MVLEFEEKDDSTRDGGIRKGSETPERTSRLEGVLLFEREILRTFPPDVTLRVHELECGGRLGPLSHVWPLTYTSG